MRDLQITLKIIKVTVQVEEKIPICVVWQRGNKKATTKKRMITDTVPTAVFEEKFQINSQMEVDGDGNPTKSKMSKLTVASDKQHGLLGKADLDLSKFVKDDFMSFTLPLESCTESGVMVDGATIEVAL